jgi:hypothetical protein
MIRTALSLAAAGMLVSAGAMAQNATKTEPAQDQGSTAQTSNNSDATGSHGGDAQAQASNGQRTLSIRQDMKDTLQKAGFSNVHVVPDSFLVQAKDKNGHPVAMIINPHSMTEVVDEGPVAQGNSNSSNDGSNGAMNTASADNAMSGGDQQAGTFTSVPKQDKLSSSIVGLSVYNDQNQDIGTIKDIAYTHHHVAAYIVGVGGFLGMGDHYVAMNPSAVKLNWDGSSKQWQAKVDATADQLKSAPAFQYPGQG